MNSLKLAMQTAGVPMPPLIKRVWLWINDHPGKTAKDIALALGEPTQRVASRLSELKSRQMVSFTYDASRRHGKGVKHVMRYSATQKQFDLLPMPRKPKPAPKPVLVTPGPVTNMDIPDVKPHPVVFIPHTVDIDGMTVRDARELYGKLHKMFGGEL